MITNGKRKKINGRPVGAEAIVRTILTKVDKEDVKEIRELLHLLHDTLHEKHISRFATTVVWLSKNIKTIIDAKRLTGDFRNAMELIDLVNRVKQLGLEKYKEEIWITDKEFKDAEDAIFEIEQGIIPRETLREAKSIFEDHIE